MNLFTDIVFIFVFVFSLLYFGLIDITSTNIVSQKIFIFIAVMIFSTLMDIMKSIRCKTPIDMWSSITTGLGTGILSFVGHTILFDLWYMPETNGFLSGLIDGRYITVNVLTALFICITITIGRSIGFIFTTKSC